MPNRIKSIRVFILRTVNTKALLGCLLANAVCKCQVAALHRPKVGFAIRLWIERPSFCHGVARKEFN